LVPSVDYCSSEVARRYARGRALADEALDRWAAAVLPLVPGDRSLVVLDVGAGTGIFARAWPQWCACRVIALEPADAMRAELTRDGLPAAVSVIAGRGELVPLRDASIDVAWLSAVVHHLDDLDRCATELRRVLVDDGTVLIRGLFADLGTPAALEFFPGSQRARSAFPSTTAVSAVFARSGFDVAATLEVQHARPSTAGEAIERTHRLRHADSLLAQFSDEQIAHGLAALERCEPSRTLEPTRLGLVALRVL
jgi:ubiquinone/menaquinone biosynthesis C-methylase UbiE